MTNTQIKILRYLYNSPKSFCDLKTKFSLNDDTLIQILNGDSYFEYYYDNFSCPDSFDDRSICINNYGISFIDNRRYCKRLVMIPIAISFVALLKSFDTEIVFIINAILKLLKL